MNKVNFDKYYQKYAGNLFIITSIDTIRDGGTIEIKTTGKTFYLNKQNTSFHTEYPLKSENKINDPLLIEYLIERIDIFVDKSKAKIEILERILQNTKNIIQSN